MKETLHGFCVAHIILAKENKAKENRHNGLKIIYLSLQEKAT